MARDRKRAKQRRDRRRAQDSERSTTTAAGRARTTPTTQPERADVPGALDHASADVDEFDAALVRGAGGVTDTPGTEAEDGLPDAAEEDLQLPEAVEEGGADGGGDRRGGAPAAAEAEHVPSPVRGANRVWAFLQASWAELQRVQWPDRRQTTQATAVVLGFVVVAGLYLGAADFVAKEIVEFIL